MSPISMGTANMHLSRDAIRARAAHFADDWKSAHYERGESQTFYNEFFKVFGVTRRRVASFEEPVRKMGDKRGFIDLFWKGVLLVEQKSAGKNLIRAKQQAFDYFPGLKEEELPRYILISDFQAFELLDLDENREVRFLLQQLPDHIDDFDFILRQASLLDAAHDDVFMPKEQRERVKRIKETVSRVSGAIHGLDVADLDLDALLESLSIDNGYITEHRELALAVTSYVREVKGYLERIYLDTSAAESPRFHEIFREDEQARFSRVIDLIKKLLDIHPSSLSYK